MLAERRELGIDAAERDRWLIWASSKKEKMTSSTISFNEELALRHRIGEKRMLWMYRDLAMEELHLMEQMSRVVSRRTWCSSASCRSMASIDMCQSQITRISLTHHARKTLEPLTRSNTGTNESTATSTMTMPDRPRFRCESLRALGREVWARWQKGSFWYKGHVTAVNILRNDAGVTFNVRFDDGDVENSILSSNIRWGSKPFDLSRVGDLDGRVLFTDRNDVLKAIGMSDDSDDKKGGVGAVGSSIGED